VSVLPETDKIEETRKKECADYFGHDGGNC